MMRSSFFLLLCDFRDGGDTSPRSLDFNILLSFVVLSDREDIVDILIIVLFVICD